MSTYKQKQSLWFTYGVKELRLPGQVKWKTFAGSFLASPSTLFQQEVVIVKQRQQSKLNDRLYV